ncbi:MAG: DUF4405 domain-containing protein [Desulfotomaculales bacterium]
MRKARLYFWLACGLFLTGAGLAVSGFVRWLVLPGGGGQGFRGGRWAYPEPAFIFTRGTWDDIHKFLAVVFVGLVAAHVVLHWDWLVGMLRPPRRR